MNDTAPSAYSISLARDYITSMTTRPYTQTHHFRPDDIYDLGQEMLRDLLCSDGSTPDAISIDYYTEQYKQQPAIQSLVPTIAEQLYKSYATLLADKFSMQFISELCLENSVCPVHHDDYASCFDDDLDDCRLIREYFPDHDS